MRIAPLLLVLAAGAFAGWPSSMDKFRQEWSLSPAGSARKGTWSSRRLVQGDVKVFVRPDSGSDGSVKAIEWWGESGPREVDIPDDLFWNILDGLSDRKEWTEADPDALPKPFSKALEGPASQGFLCRSCSPSLVGATWVGHKTTRLRVAANGDGQKKGHVHQPGLAPGITGDGLKSLASQKSFELGAVNPCRQGGGDCLMEFSGPKGQKWTFQRASGTAAWDRMEASWQAGPWWSPEWNWDSLKVAGPKEFSGVLSEWISADADVAARNLLAPVEPVLAFPVSAWMQRSLPGMKFGALADSLGRLDAPPINFDLVRGPRLQAGVDAFGRRWIKVGPAKE